MLHQMKLKESPFNRIISGEKTIEFRLYDEKRQKINIGDEIEFFKLPLQNEKIKVKVLDLYKDTTFQNLFSKLIPDENEANRKASSMREFYSEEEEKKFGVVGIKIKLIERDGIMNETLKTLKERRACRKFKSDMVDKETLDLIIEAGKYAPTGKGMQSPIILAITNQELIKKFRKINAEIGGFPEGMDPFYNAPVILVVLAKKDCFTHVYDGSLVMGNLMNAAESLGIGSIWIHRAKEEFESDFGKELLKSLGIEDEYEGIGHCALGYWDMDKTEPKPRKENYVYYID